MGGGPVLLVTEGEQVESDARPVAVVAVLRPVEAGRSERLTTVRALECGDQREGHEDEQESGHGSNYALYQIKPRVAFLTGYDNFLPYWLAC